jgi:hypothetical protein
LLAADIGRLLLRDILQRTRNVVMFRARVF